MPNDDFIRTQKVILGEVAIADAFNVPRIVVDTRGLCFERADEIGGTLDHTPMVLVIDKAGQGLFWAKPWLQLRTQPADDIALTKRERAIAVCLAKGLSQKLIADELDIEEQTVKSHFYRIKKKWHMEKGGLKALRDEARRRGYKKG